MANDKKVLTPAEFEKLTESINKRIYELSSIYIAILARDAGISFETINTEYGNEPEETEQFLEEVKEEYGVDLRNISEEAFFSMIPLRYQETFKQIKEQYLKSDVKEVSEADSEAYNLLEKEVAVEEDKVARDISNYDLSQIPSDFYNSAKWIRKVNFENTGAKLDLRQFDFDVYITGSIKGCDLISFNQSAYRKIINDGTRENTMAICPTKESLDENQYETVIEGYKDDKSPYIASGLYDLLTAPELQEKNEWVFDKAFKSDVIDYEAWKILIPELKDKHPEYFEAIKNSPRISTYDLSVILPYTTTNLLEENIDWFTNIFRKADGTVDMDEYLKRVFQHCNSEFQMNHFDEILGEIKGNDKLIEQLWAYSEEEVREKNMLKILDAIMPEGNVKDSFTFSQIMQNSPENMPQECLDKVFKLYEDENSNIRDYIDIFWKNIGKKEQAKYLLPFMQRQKDLGITSYEIYRLWQSTDGMIRYNSFDTILDYVEKNIPELAHTIRGEGYIDIFRNLKKEQVEQYIGNNVPKFLSALREKYNVSAEKSKEFDAKYDKSFALVLFELEKQVRLNAGNLNIIIDNLPKLGKETINRIFNSNSEMVVNYAPQLISAVANLDKKEAIETIEKVEHIFSQDNLPTFMRMYKYFELVVDKDNNNLLNQISSGQKRNMSPVLSNTRSVELSKRIIFADLMKISMDSNNKSLRKFVDRLEKGNEAYVKFVKNGRTIDELTEDERQEFQTYIKTIHSLYEESGAYNQDKAKGIAISLSGDIQKDAIALGNRYAREGLTDKLPDLALQSIIGPYQELFAGITTISQIREYMDNRLEESNKRHRELAMNGTYIPVVKGSTEELLFSPEQYDEIRTKMQGLSYYNTGKFVIDETAYVAEAENEREQLFTSADSNVSTSELEATKNRNAIKELVEKALAEKMGLEVEDHVTGNLQNGFVELIDTGSTGRGTNLPGDGDFDFTLKVDKVILEDPKKMEQLKSALREVLAKPSSEQDSKIEEPNGQFRYKKVAIEGAEKPLDIDITFMQKDGKVTYSTDMCVRDRLEGLKRDNPEGYQYAISNIVLAKRVLKEEGLYKKASSPGATEYGGFGGVGVENWILENGGSFAKAMDTFIETANKSQGFDDFKVKYPIYDFGQNHMAKSYQHDSFVKGLTSQGYARMQERFKELRKELKPIPRVTESNTVTMKNIVKNALQNEEIGIEDVENADRDMANSSRDISVDARET